MAKGEKVELQQLLRETEMSKNEDSTDRTSYILVTTGIGNSDSPSVGMGVE